MARRKAKALASAAAQTGNDSSSPSRKAQAKKLAKKAKKKKASASKSMMNMNESFAYFMPKKAAAKNTAAAGSKFKSRKKAPPEAAAKRKKAATARHAHGMATLAPLKDKYQKGRGKKVTAILPPESTREIRLPGNWKILGRVPWLERGSRGEEDEDDSAVVDLTQDDEDSIVELPRESSSPSQNARLPTDDFDRALMERFSRELFSFAEYVCLTEAEKAAREAVLERMHHTAVRIFQKSPEIDVSSLELQVYGSYACKDVCTFRSDVDVALWGVVSSKTRRKPQKPLVDLNEGEPETSLIESKVQKKNKWLGVLATMDEQNDMSPDPSTSEEPTHCSSRSAESHQKYHLLTDKGGPDRVEEDDPPLFVVDRRGVLGDFSQENDDMDTSDQAIIKTSASVSTQATVTESEVSVEQPEAQKSRGQVDDNSKSDDDDDNDTADKLTESTIRAPIVPPPEATAFLSLASSDIESEDEVDHDPTVHFLRDGPKEEDLSSLSFSRRRVIDGLQQYFRGLRNSGMSTKIQLISRARVPIIKMESNLGVEVDCSIGGMNGADTSMYATRMCRKYKSFGPVVVALKIIMGQQELDIPYLGGLGSYKLYVLVASHISSHLQLGGKDDPAEIFLSFVFRYGTCVGYKRVHQGARTFIGKDDVISCSEGGKADLSNVFLIQDCRVLFGEVWKRLLTFFRKTGTSRAAPLSCQSFLAQVIHTASLVRKRQEYIANAENFVEYHRATGEQRLQQKGRKAKSDSSAIPAQQRKRDLTEDELIAGYNGSPSKKRRG